MRTPRRLVLVFVVLLALGGAGCALLERLGLAGNTGRPFSHVVHGAKEELECKDCHPLAAKEDHAGMPKMKQCKLCHEGVDENKPADRKLEALVGEKPEWSSFTALSDEVIFSHQAHVTRAKIA